MGYVESPKKSSAGTVVALVVVGAIALLGVLAVVGFGAVLLFAQGSSTRFKDTTPVAEAAAYDMQMTVAEVEIASEETAAMMELSIVIDAEGNLTLDGKQVEASAMAAAITERTLDVEVFQANVKVDPNCAYRHLVAVQEVLNKMSPVNVVITTGP